MVIKEVLQYDYSYAEYLVSDGQYDLVCMCLSVPLKNHQTPQKGMQIKNLFAFSFLEELVVRIVIPDDRDKAMIAKDENKHFRYKMRGVVQNVKKPLVQVFGFLISLEYYYPNGLENICTDGDYIEFYVDRLDCTVE